MKKLMLLLDRCKCGVFLTVNEHRDYYKTAKEKIEEIMGGECPPEIPDDVLKIMIDTDTVVELQFYPDTPIGFFVIYHYNLDKCLDLALEYIEEEDAPPPQRGDEG